MFRKIASILLSIAMLLTFCACGSGGDKDKTDGASSGSGELSSADVDAATFKGLKFKTNPDLDFGGKTIKVARDTAPQEGISENYDRELAIKEVIEEKYNVKIEYVEYGSNATSLAENMVLNHMSGTAWADIVFTTSPNLLSLLTNEGIFRAMDEYIDFENERFKLTSVATKYVDGKHYSYYPTQTDAGYFVYYNTSILADNNCEDPRELYEAGKWDWAAFENTVKSCTGMVGGKTVYGLAGSNVLDGLMASNGMSVISADTSKGKVSCNLFTEPGKKVLDFVRKLSYEYKAVDGTYGSHNGIETFNNSYAAMLIGPQYYGSHLVQTGIPYEMVPLPIGPDTKTHTNLCQYCYCYSISTHSEYSTEDLLQIAFELERNDPAIGDTYRKQDYEGKLQAFIEQYVDQANHYFDDTQAEFVYDFINKDTTVSMVDWVTDDLKTVISTKVYYPISTGEDVRSRLTAIESEINAALDEQF